MICGIYCYKDLLNNESVVYIGKDSNIATLSRHKNHYKPSRYNEQQINRVLQNNPDRYKYETIYEGEFDEWLLNTLEVNTIAEFKLSHDGKRPKFNFTDGGEGMRGFHPSKDSRRKMSESHKGEKHHLYKKHHSEETRKKISESLKGGHHSNETKNKMCESHLIRYPRIVKNGFRENKQVYAIKYGGRIIKTSISIEKLERELDLLKESDFLC